MRILIVISAVLIGLAACDHTDRASIKQVNKMLVKLDSVETVFTAIDWNRYKELHSTMKQANTFIAENFDRCLAADSNLVGYYGPYAAATKELGRAMDKRGTKIKDEIEFTQNQLNDLKADLKGGIITDADSINIYIANEYGALLTVVENVDHVKSLLEVQAEAYDLIQPKIDLLFNIVNKKP